MGPGRPTIPVFLHTLSDGVGVRTWGAGVRGSRPHRGASQMALVVENPPAMQET